MPNRMEKDRKIRANYSEYSTCYYYFSLEFTKIHVDVPFRIVSGSPGVRSQQVRESSRKLEKVGEGLRRLEKVREGSRKSEKVRES